MPNIFEKMNNLPCFTKQSLKLIFQGSDWALDERIKRALKNGKIFPLKKGLYTTNIAYLKEPAKEKFREFIAGKLKYPSYLSLEYVLAKYGLLTEATCPITSISLKTNRIYRNFLGTFKYSNLKKDLFFGFKEETFYSNTYFIADKAKAMFDFLYLKNNLGDLKTEILDELRINWENFNNDDFKLFKEYVLRSKSKKMLEITKILEENIKF